MHPFNLEHVKEALHRRVLRHAGFPACYRPIKNTLMQAERQRLLELHAERGEQRQADVDLTLLKAVALAQALKQREG